MKLSENQRILLQSIIHNIFVEIPELYVNPTALSDLAYAAHNLPKWEIISNVEREHIRKLFQQYHKDHGYRLFDFYLMIEALDKNIQLDSKEYIKNIEP